ncbi:helix-turn-helix transcriptional regulator [Hamadaea tsunoensis]|uniref:helix-turn-helix transcriptional regulator n=1 Tax=Hamadaea tsunoensis TaxID=53368 RepID=UPI00041B7789|nr:helix-turn-helix transcriptional regulator [Hamadaea tsunoensis]
MDQKRSTVADRRLNELGSFLAARRAEVTPTEVGLPHTGSRRLRGLRREEVAMLAGVGASWYAWIEQGRAKNVSPSVLSAIANVLRLNEAQRQYMMRMAGYAAPVVPGRTAVVDHELTGPVVDSFLPNPAYFLDRYWNIVAANVAARRLLDVDGPCNYLDLLFGHPASRERFPHWEHEAAEAAGRLRAQRAELLDDPVFEALIRRLRAKSPAFTEVWDRHIVSNEAASVQTLHHPQLGRVSLQQLWLQIAAYPGLQLVLLHPGVRESAGRGTLRAAA